MSKKRKKFEPNVFMEHYSDGKSFVMLSRDILTHPAYVVLNDKYRSILMHMLSYLSQESSKNPEELQENGFSFTWKMCNDDCSERTFSNAMKEFVRVGWIQCKLDEQLNYSWQRNIYRISDKWRSCVFSDAELAKNGSRAQKKEARLKRKKKDKSELLRKFTPLKFTGSTHS